MRERIEGREGGREGGEEERRGSECQRRRGRGRMSDGIE